MKTENKITHSTAPSHKKNDNIKPDNQIAPWENQRIIDEYDYLGRASSVMDCTGLIPAAPLTSAELDSYEALYPFTPTPVTPQKDSRPQSPTDKETP